MQYSVEKQREFQAQAMNYKCFNNLGASYTQEFVIVSGTLLLMPKQKNCIHLFILKYENSLHTEGYSRLQVTGMIEGFFRV